MKTMNRMQMQECCCCCMMAMTMKGSVYIIIGNEQIKQKESEQVSFNYSSSIGSGVDKRLGRG